jgi:hypothetical protein
VISHLELRRYILDTAKIIRLIKLNRSIFPGIDVFPVIIELERCADPETRKANIYQFFDLWQLHPVSDAAELEKAYTAIRNHPPTAGAWPFPETRTARYTIRQGLLEDFSRFPFFEARPSLFPFMRDVFAESVPEVINLPTANGNRPVKVNTVRGRNVVKLGDLAVVKIGLQSGDNPRFYRAAKGVTGGAAKGGYKEVDPKLTLKEEMLSLVSLDEQKNGIQVNDPSSDRYFLPLDKAAASDIASGLLPMFWRPIEFYIDWSRSAVETYKNLSGARFQGSEYYFRKGISFSNTGIYSPTYRLSHGGVFDQTGSCIFSEVLEPEVLLGILASTLLKYLAKSFINHGAHAQLDDLPIVLPSKDEAALIQSKVREIINEQKINHVFDYRDKLAELDEIIFDMYGLESDERAEINVWYQRHYPRLFDSSAPEA